MHFYLFRRFPLSDTSAPFFGICASDHLEFIVACREGKQDVAIKIIEQGLPLEREYVDDTDHFTRIGRRPLEIACNYTRLETVDALLGKGANPNAKNRGGRTPLMFAAEHWHTDTCEALLDAGADCDAQDEGGDTALMYAAYAKCAAAVQLLLSRGAKKDLFTYYSRETALMRALLPRKYPWHRLFESDKQASIVLIDAGADLDVQNSDGITPLIRSLNLDDALDIVRKLLVAGAQVNKKGPGGKSALFFVKSVDDVELLLDFGADINQPDDKGRTFLSLVESGATEELRRLGGLLRSRGLCS